MYFSKKFFQIDSFKPIIDVILDVKTLFSPHVISRHVWIGEEDDTIIIKVVLPGFKKEHIDVRANEKELYIKAEKNVEGEFEEQYWRKYIEDGKIRIKGKISMPIVIEPESGKAKMDAGILTIKFKKKETGEKVPVD